MTKTVRRKPPCLHRIPSFHSLYIKYFRLNLFFPAPFHFIALGLRNVLFNNCLRALQVTLEYGIARIAGMSVAQLPQLLYRHRKCAKYLTMYHHTAPFKGCAYLQ